MSFVTPKLQFIIPAERTNYVTNPSFEIGTTGWTLLQSAITRVTTQSRRGVAALCITPNANQIAGASYALAVTDTVTYSFSVDIKDVAAQTFYLEIQNAAAAVVATSATWTGNGYWKRRHLTFTAASTDAHVFFVKRASINSVTPYYVDGAQIEIGAVSTYLDGDMVGFVTGETAYRWNGSWQASTSWRSGQTRSGGTYLNLSTYARLITISGLGMASLSNIAVPSSLGGSYYQNTVANERSFSLVMNINGNGDYAVIQRAREALISAVKPDKTIYRQPVLIQYDQLDSASMEIGETLMIPAVYESGMEMDGYGDSYNEKFAMNFRMYMPLIQQQGEHAAVLGYQTEVLDADYILMRTSAGIWQEMANGLDNTALAILPTNDGYLYVGGSFALAGGVANTAYIAKWNGTAWSALGQGGDDAVKAMSLMADGSLYVGGDFTHMHATGGADVANTAYIAKWDGAVWTALSTGTNGHVDSLLVASDGSLYAGGSFALAGGVANTVRIAKWSGGVWTPLGTGAADNSVTSLVEGADGSIYAAGTFTGMGGVANTAYIAKWNGTVWTPLGTGANSWINDLVIMPDGTLYAGGNFSSMSGIANTAFIAKWNGVAWTSTGLTLSHAVYHLQKFNNDLLVSGAFLTVNGISAPSSNIFWNGSAWSPVDVSLPGAAASYALTMDQANNLYIGFNGTGSAWSTTVTVPSVGTANTYPKFTFTGPGTIWQVKNYTTGKAIYFNLTLLAGEVAGLSLDPQNIFFTSTFRGNIMNTILPGSNLDFELSPGTNNLSAYMYGGTTAATAIYIYWRDQYWSLDGAVR